MEPAVITRLSEMESAHYDLASRLSGLEKRAAREREPGEYVSHKSLGDIIANDAGVRSLNSDFRGKRVVKITGESAAITSGTTTVGNATSPGTSLVPAQRMPDIIAPYQRQMTIRDLLGSARTTSNAIEYPVETGFTNNAAPVAETTLKPTSDLTFDLRSAPVRTIAHIFKASRQILDDGPALASYIERRGTYGLKIAEENQILTGNGVGQNLHGLIPQATAFEVGRIQAGDTQIDIINRAISQAEESDLPVTGIILSRADWRKIVGLKDAGSNYISPNSPFGFTQPMLWNLPVAVTNALPAGEFVTGAFKDAATIFDRLDVEVLLSSENEDDFVKNMVTIRVEERLALVVFRPEAIIHGSFSAG
jgi:HK97 family phage major capsid protein